jgi:hypothetical protein
MDEEISALLTLPKLLAELAVGLLNRKKDDGTRQRLGDLLCQVADCVSSIAKSIEEGVLPTERCLELDTYAAHLHKLVGKETDEQTADRLTFWLQHVSAVPGIAQVNFGQRVLSETKPSWTKGKRFEHAQGAREIAGIIRAVGNLVRV